MENIDFALNIENANELKYINRVQLPEDVDFREATYEPHTIVLVNHKRNGSAVVWNLTTKCRRCNAEAMVRQILRAVVCSWQCYYEKRSEECVQISKNYGVGNEFVTKVLASNCAYVTDKNGHILETSCVVYESIDGGYLPFKKMFRLTKSMPVVQLMIGEGRDWADPEVAAHVGEWVRANFMHMKYVVKFNEKLAEISEEPEEVVQTGEVVNAPEEEVAA